MSELSVKERVIKLKDSTMLTDAEFCEMAGISTATLHRIKKGEAIQGRTIARIAAAHNVDYDWLMFGVSAQVMEIEPVKTNSDELEEDYISHLKKEVDFYRQIIARLTGVPAANFLEASAEAVEFTLIPGGSVRAVA